jgi:uncharacterized protein involved in exopolysaccharide biosynthesis
MQFEVAKHVDQDAISLKELVQTLWRGRMLVFCFAVLVTLGVGVLAFVLPKRYVASIIISPVADSSSSGQLSNVTSLLSEVGGLAGLTGLSTAGSDQKVESVAVLQSEALTERYIQANDLLPVLDDGRGKIKTLWRANEYFGKKIRSVKTDTKSGLITLAINWKDPKIAAAWANGLVKMTNDYLRGKALDESERHVTYLSDQASKTDVVGVKQVIYSLLQNEISKSMLARGREEYALKVIDPAVAPETPTSPKPSLWILGAFLGSLVFSVLVAFVRVAWSLG